MVADAHIGSVQCVVMMVKHMLMHVSLSASKFSNFIYRSITEKSFCLNTNYILTTRYFPLITVWDINNYILFLHASILMYIKIKELRQNKIPILTINPRFKVTITEEGIKREKTNKMVLDRIRTSCREQPMVNCDSLTF